MALSFDLLAALAVSGIAAILAIYVIVVYKKGWLRRESKTDQAYYLCPSQKCRRVFKKPVWLTDLSHTPPESYQACPHCGMNIQVASPSPLATTMSEAVTKPSTGASEDKSPQDRLRFTRREVTAGKSEPDREPKSSLQTGDSNSQPRSEDEQTPKPLFQFPQTRKETQQKPHEAPKKSGEKSSIESQRKCSHFFGYVKTLPKNTPIPDECLWCPSIVDCLSHEQKVEAEA
jgi:hypothetical protein